MKSKGIRISDSKPLSTINVLNVSPTDILEFIDYGQGLNWAILEIEATGDLGEKKWKKLHQYETLGEKITRISWDELKEVSNEFRQVIWFTAIGCKDLANVKFYKEDVEMYESCEIVIEIIDGGCCEVFSHDHQLINKIAKHFKEVEYLEPDWNSE